MLQNICFQGLSCEQRPTTDLHGDLFSLVLCIGQLVYHHQQLHHQWFTTTHYTTSEGKSSKKTDMKHVSSSRWMQDIAESLKFIKHHHCKQFCLSFGALILTSFKQVRLTWWHTAPDRLRYAFKKKKRHYLGIFPKRRTPPPFGNPLSKKFF